jgi:hypothetical protein
VSRLALTPDNPPLKAFCHGFMPSFEAATEFHCTSGDNAAVEAARRLNDARHAGDPDQESFWRAVHHLLAPSKPNHATA